MTIVNSKVKKKKKNITLGIAHIKATFNNTIVTFTDIQGSKIAGSSAGANNFKGAKKSTPYAAQITVDAAAEKAKEHGLRTLSVRIQGGGSQRESAIRALFSQSFIVTTITDVSGVPHNGCKAPKRRRV